MWRLLIVTCAALNIFFVPHSHIDVGWVRTVDDYYTMHAFPIISNILILLSEDPSRRFVWSEAIFLQRFLEENPEKIPVFKEYLKEGRLEIVGGGWVMNDEALVDFEGLIRQMTAGHNFFHKVLDVEHIKVAWQLDPFGHSSLTPAVFEKMGFEQMVMARISGNYRDQLIQDQNMEFVWKSDAFGANKGIFTHLLYDHYSLPNFLDIRKNSKCFFSLPAPLNELQKCMISLTNFAKKVSQAYKTENVMILFGDDVFFGDLELAKKQFEFIESLRDLAPASSYIRFATASEYFTAVASENLAYSVYEGDFHPYISTDIRNRPISWTGFYASRPALKQKIFKTSALVRAAEISLGLIKKQEFQGFEVSTMLHHDAITGTCRSEVADDYFVRLEKDIKTSEKAIREAYSALLIESDKKFEMNKPYKAYVIYNPINWDVKKIISLDSASQFAVVYDTNGKPLKSQSVPNLDIYKIYFELTLRSLSFNTIFISEEKFNCTWCSVPSVKTGKSTVANSFYSLKFYEGLLDTISTKEIEVNVMTSIVKYQAYLGGAYEFRPPKTIEQIGEAIEYSVYTGEVTTIVKSVWKHKKQEYRQTVILGNNDDTFELDFEVFAEPGDEIFLRFKHSDHPEDWFYTFNSADIRLRKAFSRQVIGGDLNYYPIVGGLLIKDEKQFLQIFPRFPTGAGMPNDKEFELHLHRNPQNDDVLGLGLPIKDPYPVDHQFLFSVSSFNNTAIWRKYLLHKNPPILFAVTENPDEISLDLWKSKIRYEDWENNAEYSLTNENVCVYLSGISIRDTKMYANVLNICDKSQEFQLSGAKIVQDVFLDERAKVEKKKDVKVDSEIVFEANQNSGRSLLRYPNEANYGKISSFNLNSFEITHELALLASTEKIIGKEIETEIEKEIEKEIAKEIEKEIAKEIEKKTEVAEDDLKNQSKFIDTTKTIDLASDKDFIMMFYLVIFLFSASVLLYISNFLIKRKSNKKVI